MNMTCLLGRITKDPEIKYGQNSQIAVCKFTVALDRGKDKDGKDKGADYPNCVAYGKTAENIGKYFSKGQRIGITGHITTGSYEGKNGKVYTTEVTVDKFDFVESKKAEPMEDPKAGFSKLDDDFIPF